MVVLVALVVALPVFALGEVSANDARARHRVEQQRSTTDLAARAADLVSLQIAVIANQITNLVADPELREAVQKREPSRLAELLRSRKAAFPRDTLRLFALDFRDARLLAQSPSDYQGAPTDYSASDFAKTLQATLDMHGYFISEAYALETPGLGPAVVIAATMREAGRLGALPVGILAAELDLSRLWIWLAPLFPAGDDAYIVDGRGRFLARAKRLQDASLVADLRSLATSPVVAGALSGAHDAGQHDDPLEGGPRLLASAPIAVAPPTLRGSLVPDAPWRWQAIVTRPLGVGETELEGALTQLALARYGFIALALVAAYALSVALRQVVSQRAQLAAANTELARATRAKSEFLANMSHELRTPLNAVIGFSDVLVEGIAGPLNEKQKDYLGDVRSSGQHLLGLINDILDLSKVEAGRMELEPTTISLREVIESTLSMVGERASRHGIAITCTFADGIPSVVADERKLKQIVLNLLSNAIKFTPSGGEIAIATRHTEDAVEVSVRDTGVGISPADQLRIFEEFAQAKHGRQAVEGTGLGLTLTKRFVELHGGRIWVESRPGYGSTFTFRLPTRALAVPNSQTEVPS
jgi:signal transduction histidine kinase